MKNWSVDRKILIIIIAVLLINIGLNYRTTRNEKEENENDFFREYYIMNSNFINTLDMCESYIVAYPLEGMHSKSQDKKRLKFQNDITTFDIKYDDFAHNKMIGHLELRSNIHKREDLLDEMYIYINRFETVAFPATEENLKYMNNLLLLIQELRTTLEEQDDMLREYNDYSFFYTDEYFKFKDEEKIIHEKNNWVIKKTNASDGLGEKVEGIENIATEYNTYPKAKGVALEYFKIQFPEVTLEDINKSGGGGTNILGKMFKEFEFDYNNIEVNVLETGDIRNVRFNIDNYHDDDEDNNLESITPADKEIAHNNI